MLMVKAAAFRVLGSAIVQTGAPRTLIAYDHSVEGGLGERGAQVEHIPVNVSHGRRERRVLRAHVRDAGLAVVGAHDVREA